MFTGLEDLGIPHPMSSIWFWLGFAYTQFSSAAIVSSGLALAIRRRRRALTYAAGLVGIGFAVIALTAAVPMVLETLAAVSGENKYERAAFENRTSGNYGWWYLLHNLSAYGLPQLFWIRRVRRSALAMFLISVVSRAGQMI